MKQNGGAGPEPGTRILAEEEVLAFRLLHSLSEEQLAQAVIAEEAPRDIRAAGEPHAPDEPPRGLAVAEFNEAQRETLMQLLAAYAGALPLEVAEADMQKIKDAGVEKIHFAWAGAQRQGVGHYYCIEGPTFVCELCNVQPDAAGNPANHIHDIWRSASGDFGLSR